MHLHRNDAVSDHRSPPRQSGGRAGAPPPVANTASEARAGRLAPGARSARGAPPASDEPALRHGRRVLELVLGPPADRLFDVRWWTGAVDRGRARPAAFTFVVARPGALRRMLLPPSELAIVEAYLTGDVDVDGDMEAAATLGDLIASRVRSARALALVLGELLALPARDAPTPAARAAGPLVEGAGRVHDPARDRAAVRYHYDVGNDFYALWLDPRMVYSCAYFRSPDDSLARAQAAKLDLVCRKLRLRPGERFLDVGCGWGALVMHAAANYGVRALGITLSERQAELARRRIADAGLGDRCRVEVRDYRAPLDGAPFDKIASVGMVEHVGVEKLPVYFAALRRALAPGGLLLNHGIVSLGRARPTTLRDRIEYRLWRRGAFVHQYVFPDGELAPLHAVIAAAEAAGFETRDVESLREHYARTLRLWVARLLARWGDALRLTDERTARTWRLYMAASAHAFATGRLNVVQALLANPRDGDAGLPLTREDLYSGRPGRTASC
ncbi:MAG: class I SAM-dependent methyltransferase [Gemmatimonadaceae bacterium]